MELKAKGSKVLQTLNSVDQAAFDHGYLMSRIQQHEEVLNLLRDKLIPGASSAALRAQLTKTQAMVQHHLDLARKSNCEDRGVALAGRAPASPVIPPRLVRGWDGVIGRPSTPSSAWDARPLTCAIEVFSRAGMLNSATFQSM